jgi:response regulator RpfG family c-di-GMP phosphodiesterase
MHVYEEKNFKIIIVDENIQFRNTLASRLRFLGYHVELASGGFHLLHVLEKNWDFSLVIFHEDMNDMSAEEMISLVRTHKNKVELPILYISKFSNEEKICDLIFKGANEYIVKTSNFQPIVERAQKYFNGIKNS